MIWSYSTLKTHLCMLIKPILRQMTNEGIDYSSMHLQGWN